MLPLFPKAVDFCTKMPVRIKMTHKPEGRKTCCIRFPASKYGLAFLDDIEESIDLDFCDNPSVIVEEVMTTSS